jgi:hypothetical protein
MEIEPACSGTKAKFIGDVVIVVVVVPAVGKGRERPARDKRGEWSRSWS